MLKLAKINVWLYNILNNYIFRFYDLMFNSIVRKQLKDPNKIPVIIINYNQLYYLKKLVDFLQERQFQNIVIVDNKSTYPPLLEYYKNIESKIVIEIMEKNYGHMVFFQNIHLQKKYGKGFFIITDADIVPNKNLPKDFMFQMLYHLMKYWKEITKVGFALRLDDIPNKNILKEKILNWENKFWKKQINENIYIAAIDTTFAIYKPNYPKRYNHLHFLLAHRFAKEFIAKHGGWYIDQNNLSEEQKFYVMTASESSSWLQNEKNIN